jgi:hypothetical protein
VARTVSIFMTEELTKQEGLVGKKTVSLFNDGRVHHLQV